MSVVPFRWAGHELIVLDQRVLPHKIKFLHCCTPQEVAKAIKTMAVRGAPAIGCCAAYGMVLALKPSLKSSPLKALETSARILKAARPTAVNLSWAVNRMLEKTRMFSSFLPGELYRCLLEEAAFLEKDDRAVNKAIGRWGATLLKKNSVVLTHCNTGALATAGHGTALGVIREAFLKNKIRKVLVGETRPYLQGARLTAWEFKKEKIPHELITDNMAGHFMKTEKIGAVIVGCDRVAANGDTANKIGTYSLAVLAAYHKIPFYVAMPTSSLDLGLPNGSRIPIEERSPEEVVRIAGVQVAPRSTKARHPAFDVTPAKLITAFITEHGIVKPPYQKTLKNLV
jgi:methylthioribose-1-phosphate isomerase